MGMEKPRAPAAPLRWYEIRNTGRGRLKTLNYYAPPAYTKAGDELPPARRN
jgi:hypothetical protein